MMTLDELLDFSKCTHYLEGPHVFVEALEHMSNWNKFAEYLYAPATDVEACKLYLAAEMLSYKREYMATKIMARIGKISDFDFMHEKPCLYEAFKPFVQSRYALEQALKTFTLNPETELVNVLKTYRTALCKTRLDIIGRLRTRLKRIYLARLHDTTANMRQTLMECKNANTKNFPG